ncbi:hypothetical protein [Streptomyces sp. SID10815]|uniref:hypothetical protein n=1 Tax=Streptomyces sp. SID10815 TaxID=2706027 RepID=UPI0013C6F4BE|nr:hypothetical protein [Streptomyces sp. SID10815]NEA47794.1 hypothetical protein [Streptomyces sp. SID10815]
MNKHECFPLLLSQRERSAIEMSFYWVTSKAAAADFLIRCDLSEGDLLAGFPELARAIEEMPDEDPPRV